MVVVKRTDIAIQEDNEVGQKFQYVKDPVLVLLQKELQLRMILTLKCTRLEITLMDI